MLRPGFAVATMFYAVDAKIVALAAKNAREDLAGPCNQSSCKRAITHDRRRASTGVSQD